MKRACGALRSVFRFWTKEKKQASNRDAFKMTNRDLILFETFSL